MTPLKFKEWVHSEDIPALIESGQKKLVQLEELATKAQNLKRYPVTFINSINKLILSLEEERSCIDGMIMFQASATTKRLHGRITGKIDQFNQGLLRVYRKLLKIDDPRFEITKRHLFHKVQSTDYELIAKSVESLYEIYDHSASKLTDQSKIRDDLCFMAFQSAAGFYRYLEGKEDSFLIKRLGVKESEVALINLAHTIKTLGNSHLKNFLGNKKSLDDLNHLPELKLRSSFEESKIAIQKFYDSIHPDIGVIVQEVLKNSLYLNNNVNVFYTIDSYKRLPRIVVKGSSKLKYELGLVHELAHAVHFSLQAASNPITNVDINTLTIEYVPAVFELLFLFHEYKNEDRPKLKKKILDFIIHHFCVSLYAKAFNVELENTIWAHIGDKINSSEKMGQCYLKLCRQYCEGIIEIDDSARNGWIWYHNIFDPQLDAAYLLAFIYAYHTFIKYQSFRLGPHSLIDFMKKGSEVSMNDLISLNDVLNNPNKYVKEIIDSLVEYSREI